MDKEEKETEIRRDPLQEIPRALEKFPPNKLKKALFPAKLAL
jgi:hypothetical protein